MTDAKEGQIVTVTPHLIANNLQSAESMLRDLDALDEGQLKTLRRMLLAAASNVRLLFELEADPDSGEFRLQNYGQAWMLADLLKAGDMVPSSYKTQEQVVVGLMKSMEIGVSPISGLANIMIVNNRPSVWGDLAQALVQRTGVISDHFKEEIGEKPAPGLELQKWSDTYGWRVGFYRVGQKTPYVQEYTVADAKRAHLWMNTKKQPWITDPATMLFNRARARAIRDGFADKLFGLGIIEEQRDFETLEPPRLTDQSAAPKPSLADDEPETEVAGEAAAMPDYTDRGAPETPSQDAQEATGATSTAEQSEIASGEAPSDPQGQSESGGPLL